MVPRRQVNTSKTIAAPSASGAQAPSTILSKLELRKVVSTKISGIIMAAAAHGRHSQNFQITMKPSKPSTTMVVVTATP